MGKKSIWVKIISAAGILFLISFIGYEIFVSGFDPIVTETVVESTAPKTVDVKLFMVRDEQYIIKDDTPGTVVPLIDDGKMVAKGDTVAAVCESPEDASDYTKIKDLKKNILRYEQLNTQKNINTLDINKLNSEIDLIFTDMMDVVSSGKFEDFNSSSGAFRDKLTSRQIAIDGSIDFSKKIAALKAELAQLESKEISVQSLIAEKSGYYISHADGYENLVSYNNIENVTAAQAEAALKSPPGVIPNNALGKLVCSYNWYLLTTLKSSVATQLKAGQTVKINFGESLENTINVKVYSIKSSLNGSSAVVFICNLMNEQLAGLRITNAHLVLEEFTGLKINSSAIRVKDGVSGAYVLRGNIISFRRLNIVYSQDDFAIANDEKNINNTAANKLPAHVKLYDEVVIKGKNLYEGKIVN